MCLLFSTTAANNLPISTRERADARQENPQKALELFEKVVTLEAEKGSEIKWRFKALEHLVRIHFQLRDFDQMLQVRDGTCCRAV